MALMLLERGADPAAVNEQGATALLFACVEGMEAVASKLLLNSATNADPPACMVYSRKTDETSNRTPLQAAAENGFASGVQKLLERGATVSSDALLLAARRGEAECCATLLRALVASGALDIDSGNAVTAAVVPWLSEALAAAAARGSEETLRSLCDSSVDGIAAAAASSAGEALLCACELRGADGPARGEGAGVRERIIGFLVDTGAPTGATSAAKGDGNTPLHTAAAKGLIGVSDLLLAAPVPPPLGALNAAGETPADCAKSAGHEGLAEKLRSGAPAASVALLETASA